MNALMPTKDALHVILQPLAHSANNNTFSMLQDSVNYALKSSLTVNNVHRSLFALNALIAISSFSTPPTYANHVAKQYLVVYPVGPI